MSPNDRAVSYVAQSIGFTGLALLDWHVALRQRPDLFGSGVEASSVAAHGWRTRYRRPPGMRTGRADMGDLVGVEVWALSDRRLAERIEEVTGLTVHRLVLDPVAKPTPAPARAGHDPAGDRHAGLVTKQPGRACQDCERFTAAHLCSTSAASGIERPSPRALRRCVAFTPLWDSLDKRDGRALWPELVAAEATA